MSKQMAAFRKVAGGASHIRRRLEEIYSEINFEKELQMEDLLRNIKAEVGLLIDGIDGMAHNLLELIAEEN